VVDVDCLGDRLAEIEFGSSICVDRSREAESFFGGVVEPTFIRVRLGRTLISARDLRS
jgi:hypothetical protein